MIKTKKQPVVFPMEVVEELISKTKNIRDNILIRTMAYSGLRVSECLSLKKENIHFKEKYLQILEGKGSKDRRVVLHSKLIIALDLYFSLNDFKDGDRIFELTRARVFQIVKSLDKRFHPHTLRHCYATHLLDKGVAIEIISQQLGHEDVSTTMLYAHISLVKRKKELEGVLG